MSNTRCVERPNIHVQRVAYVQRYFAAHPHEAAFTRDATPVERRVFDLPIGTLVRVVKVLTGDAHANHRPPHQCINRRLHDDERHTYH
jgi:hypothetical protein